jgi:hypothetical protein
MNNVHWLLRFLQHSLHAGLFSFSVLHLVILLSILVIAMCNCEYALDRRPRNFWVVFDAIFNFFVIFYCGFNIGYWKG